MPNSERTRSDKEQSRPWRANEVIRNLGITGFRTRKGSVYMYDGKGKTRRLEIATSTLHNKQEITVFVDSSDVRFKNELLFALHGVDFNKEVKVKVLERQEDDSAISRNSVDEVEDPDSLYLAVMVNEELATNAKATLIPTVGYNVFDSRKFKEGDRYMRESHLGNIVVDVFYNL